jgi:putative FmdB family regulatory protein
MPTYEYECSKCGHRFEEFQGITAKPLLICPKCNKKGLTRLIGAGAGLIFKGSGFYATDYKSKPSSSGKDDACPSPKKDAPCTCCPKNRSKNG